MQKLGHPKSSEVSDFYNVLDLNQFIMTEACQQLSLGNVTLCQLWLFKHGENTQLWFPLSSYVKL